MGRASVLDATVGEVDARWGDGLCTQATVLVRVRVECTVTYGIPPVEVTT